MRSLAGLLVASLLMTAGCGRDDDRPSVEFASPTEAWWPLRGNLADDAQVRAEVAEVVAQWQTPDVQRRHSAGCSGCRAQTVFGGWPVALRVQ